MNGKPGKHAGGRPTKYERRYCAELIADMSGGFSATAFAGKIGVSRSTINEWAEHHPEFSEALKAGKANRLRFWEQIAISVAAKGTGGPGAATVITFGLKNMGDDEWRDRREHEVSGPDGAPIQTEAVDQLASLPKEKRDAIRAAIRAAMEGHDDIS